MNEEMQRDELVKQFEIEYHVKLKLVLYHNVKVRYKTSLRDWRLQPVLVYHAVDTKMYFVVEYDYSFETGKLMYKSILDEKYTKDIYVYPDDFIKTLSENTF